MGEGPMLNNGEIANDAARRPASSNAIVTEKSEAIVQSFRKDHPDASFRIVRGFARGDRALLLVEGETSWAKVRTEVQMVREKGSWRLESEVLQIRMGDD